MMRTYRPEHGSSLILNVEDNEASRYANARVLKQAGFLVQDAEGGERALHLTRELHPDLILLDVHMPDLDGLEVCRQLKADPLTATIPVLHLTATYGSD